MSRTLFLFSMMIVVILMHYFPVHASAISSVAIVLGALFLGVSAWKKYPALYREHKRVKAERAAEEAEYQRYRGELDRLKARFDPEHRWNEFTQSHPPEYRDALAELHARYRVMLDARFGARER